MSIEPLEHFVIHLEKGKKQSSPFAIWSGNTWKWNYEEVNKFLCENRQIKTLEIEVQHWNKNDKVWVVPNNILFKICPQLVQVKMKCSERMKFRQLPNWMRAEEISYNPQLKKGNINDGDITSLVVHTHRIERLNVGQEFINGMNSVCDQIRILKEISVTFKSIEAEDIG